MTALALVACAGTTGSPSATSASGSSLRPSPASSTPKAAEVQTGREAPTASPEEIVGVWTNTGYYVTFTDDGEHRIHGTRDGSPFEYGPYEFDGRVLTLTTAEGSEACPAGSTGVYEIEFSPNGDEADVTILEPDRCYERRNRLPQGLVRAPPVSPSPTAA